MIRVGLIGVGKMGISHYAILNAHPEVDVVAIADTSGLVLAMLQKHLGVKTFKDYRQMFEVCDLDCVVVATPPKVHAETVGAALERGLHVFVEKPLSLTVEDGRALVRLAFQKHLVGQVGYHHRFLATFQEAKRLVDSGLVGQPYHITGEAYGQVVIREEGSSWRAKKGEGGGCLHEYCSHVIDLMNYLVGPPTEVLGTVLKSVYSVHVEDAVYATLSYPNDMSGQIAVNWSDETYRRMTTRITLQGTRGKIIADREECRLYLSNMAAAGRAGGWTIRNITQLQPPVAYYLRGEEYTAQLDYFVQSTKGQVRDNINSFASALETDLVLDRLIQAARTRT